MAKGTQMKRIKMSNGEHISSISSLWALLSLLSKFKMKSLKSFGIVTAAQKFLDRHKISETNN